MRLILLTPVEPHTNLVTAVLDMIVVIPYFFTYIRTPCPLHNDTETPVVSAATKGDMADTNSTDARKTTHTLFHNSLDSNTLREEEEWCVHPTCMVVEKY